MGRTPDITGQTFGRLFAAKRAANYRGRAAWDCTCRCGNRKTVLAFLLIQGQTKSCGCLRREQSARNAAVGRERVQAAAHRKMLRDRAMLAVFGEAEADPDDDSAGLRPDVPAKRWHDSDSAARDLALAMGIT